MPRRRQPPYLLTLAAFILFLGAIFLWFNLQSRPIDPVSTRRINFSISQGSNLDTIASQLQELKLIRSVWAFKIQVVVSGMAQKIQAGDFALPASFNLQQVVTALTHGTTDRWTTLLEGWRREEIAQNLVDVLSPNNPNYVFDPDQFLSLTKNLEGQLFPDTYAVSRSATADQVLKILTENFTAKIENLVNQSTLSDSEALVLASLIEREAKTNLERPIIAGILLKRLEADWPLQVDATIQYLVASRNCLILTCDWWPQIAAADKKISSPYNTYAQPGLPPAPIANPSLASIQAAYQPTPTEYWFYLHDPQGQIHYAETVEEHNANIRRFLP